MYCIIDYIRSSSFICFPTSAVLNYTYSKCVTDKSNFLSNNIPEAKEESAGSQEYIAPEVLLNKGHGSLDGTWDGLEVS